MFAQNSKFAVLSDWQPYQNASKEESKDSSSPWSFERTSTYGNLSPGRFCSVDPLADQYPNWTLFHYAMNNPMRFVDPTGKWIASYDSAGKIVNVQAEKGDNLEDLYKQFGISADDFAKKYNISDLSQFEVVAGQTTFNITDFVLANGQKHPFFY
jgi:RHS repeat-associated protein